MRTEPNVLCSAELVCLEVAEIIAALFHDDGGVPQVERRILHRRLGLDETEPVNSRNDVVS